MATATTAQKDSHLRHAEYYDLTEVFDDLYARSKAQAVFTDLMPLILSEEISGWRTEISSAIREAALPA